MRSVMTLSFTRSYRKTLEAIVTVQPIIVWS